MPEYTPSAIRRGLETGRHTSSLPGTMQGEHGDRGPEAAAGPCDGADIGDAAITVEVEGRHRRRVAAVELGTATWNIGRPLTALGDGASTCTPRPRRGCCAIGHRRP